jgi:hypothetical protein
MPLRRLMGPTGPLRSATSLCQGACPQFPSTVSRHTFLLHMRNSLGYYAFTFCYSKLQEFLCLPAELVPQRREMLHFAAAVAMGSLCVNLPLARASTGQRHALPAALKEHKCIHQSTSSGALKERLPWTQLRLLHVQMPVKPYWTPSKRREEMRRSSVL